MTITDIKVYDNSGLLWSLGDTAFVSFGSFGQYIKIITRVSTSAAVTGNLTFDAAMFSPTAYNADPSNIHPVYGSAARGFILDVSSLAVSTPTSMLYYGNNRSHNIGTATLEILNVGKTLFSITHEFNLLKDVNDWMHSSDATTLDNSDAFTSYGDATTIYDVIKYYNVYLWNANGEYDANGAALAFSKNDEYNNGPGIVSDMEFEYYDGVTLKDSLLSNVDTTIRVKFDDFDSLAYRVDLILGSQDIQAELNASRDEQLGLLTYTTTTITTISGTDKYAEFLIDKDDLQYKNYQIIAVVKDAANKSTSKGVASLVKFSFTECVPRINVNWKSYLNTRTTSKIDCAGYERMCLELTIWHDTFPTETPPSPSYEDCLSDQLINNSTLLGSLQTITIPILGENHIFTNNSGTITSNFTQDEIESGTSSGNDFTKIRIFFRVEETYVGQLTTLDASFYSVFNQLLIVNNSVVSVPMVGHTINQPLEIRCAIYENDNPSADITALDVYDDDGRKYGAICEDSEYIECIAESLVAYDVQALLVKPNNISEEELFASVQSESYFATLTSPYIYDLEGDFTTAGDCKFKVQNINLDYNKIMVVCCK
jgi:hypothetical protein